LKLKQMASESLVLFGKQIKRLVDDDWIEVTGLLLLPPSL
jgi:hypothetical protein